MNSAVAFKIFLHYSSLFQRIIINYAELKCKCIDLYNFICLLSQVQRVLSFSYVQQSASFQEVSKMAFNNKFCKVELCMSNHVFFYLRLKLHSHYM